LLSDHAQRRLLVGLPCRDDHPTTGERRHLVRAKGGYKLRRRRRRKHALHPRRPRRVEERPVLRHYPIEHVERGEDQRELVELASRDEHEHSTAAAQPLKSREHLGTDLAILREGTVVVGGESEMPHGSHSDDVQRAFRAMVRRHRTTAEELS
jgi:hypothetical protein